MVQLIVRLTAVSGRAHELVQTLQTLMRRTRRQTGCLAAHVTADVDEANAFWCSEDWQDERALEEELRSDRFSQLLSLMETSESSPVLEFRVVAETHGLEYVTAARAHEEADVADRETRDHEG